ncbi:class I SAM-dependent methyltransferase [Candidatus Auribacterota bacterium]
MGNSYYEVTETIGSGVTSDQIGRMYNRYSFAVSFCGNKDVLEVACGGGMGLGFIARTARSVTGVDVDEKILRNAFDHYEGRDRISLGVMDGHSLDYDDDSFDVVILYEAIYYLERPLEFLKEAYRVLRDNGILMICTVNKDWGDFNPSPHSIEYPDVPELAEMVGNVFQSVCVFGAFSTRPESFGGVVTSFIKRAAVSMHLMPRTMKGKELLKKIFYGGLVPLPPEISEGMSTYKEPVEIAGDTKNEDYKIIYAIGRKQRSL